MRCASLVLLALVFAPPASAADGDRVVVRLKGPTVPYASVVFEVGQRRGTVVASVSKEFEADFGHRESLGLLPRAEFDALMRALERLGAGTLKSAGRPGPRRGSARRPARTIHEVEFVHLGRTHRFTVEDLAQQPDARYRRVVETVRDAVRANAGTLAFRDALLLESEQGILRVDARPRARVRVDGVLLEETTPISALPLPAGPHTVELLAVDSDARGLYEIKVEAGKTTRLAVELK